MFTSTFYNKPVDKNQQHIDLCDNASEMLLRANPKLSTNVKIMTDGDFVMLESFESCKELSSTEYKNVKTYSTSNFRSDVSKFWKNTETGFAYKMLQEYDDISVKSTYDKQYETFYWSGCEYINSLEYQQANGLLAPIWLNEKIPDRFVIFRVKDPSYWKYIKEETKPNELDFKNDILNKCEIVKTFDLTESTNLGSYIRRYYNQSNFPKSPVVLDSDGLSFSGISYKNGEFTTVKEYCNDRLWRHDDTVLEFDEYVTAGFERNGIIVANIMNIEFLFDDDDVDDYTFNRYFGLYCDVVKTDEIDVYKDGLYSAGNEYEFDVQNFDIYHTQNYITKNDNGVIIPFNRQLFSETPNRPFAADFDNIVNPLSAVFCIEDINKDLYSVNRILKSSSDDSIRITNKQIDLGLLKGFEKVVDSVTCEYEDNTTPSSLSFKIKCPIPVYYQIQLYQNNNAIGESIVATNYYYSQNPEESFNYGEGDFAMFCCVGSIKEITKAFCMAFNKTYDVGIHAYYNNDTIYLISVNSSPVYNEFNIKITPIENSTIETYFDFTNGMYLSGSSNYAHLKCKEDVRDKFFIDGYIPSRSHNGYNKIVSIVTDYDNTKIVDNMITFPNGVYYDILFDSGGVISYKTNSTSIYKKFKPDLGILSFYPVTDFEMSTYHDVTKYGNLGELKYESDWVSKTLKTQNVEIASEVINGENNIVLDDMVGDTVVTITIDGIDGLTFNDIDISLITKSGPDENGEYTISMPLMVYNNIYNNSESIQLNDNFTFDTLSTDLNVPNTKYLTSEYERCYENLNPNLMMKSKTQPWICNWVLDNGKDIRENPYRLNCNPVFGQYSFTPDLTNHDPEPKSYNQEFGYIMESPIVLNNLLGTEDINQRNVWSYIGETINTSEFETKLKSVDENWFDVFFKRDNITIYNNEEEYQYFSCPDYKLKYSLLSGGTVNTNSETFFRGIKFEFLLKSDWDEIIDNNLDNIKIKYGETLNEYKFSVVVVPLSITDGDIISEKIKVIRNDIFKTITIIQYIVIEYTDAFSAYLKNSIKPKVDLKNVTRYSLYNPSMYNNDEKVCVRGSGSIEITYIDYNFDDCECRITGTNTKFISDFEKLNDDAYLLVVTNPGMPIELSAGIPGSQKYEIIKITSIISDSYMKGVVLFNNSNSIISESQSLYIENNNINYINPTSETLPHNTTLYFIMNCNAEWFASNFNNTIVANFKYNININQKEDVVYEHIDNGGILHTSENKEYTFAIRIVEPLQNAKYEYISLLFDGEYIRYGTLPQFAAPMYRYGGKFVPLKNDVLYYTDPFIEEFSKNPDLEDVSKNELINMLRFMNTCFDYRLYDFGILKDVAFHRTNENNANIFKLTNGQQPIYPTSNRFSIGHRNINVYNASWDPWYFTRTLSETLETDCHGTLSMKENKSFLGSKLLSVPEQYIFNIFSYAEYDKTKTQTEDVITLINGSHIELTVNIEQKIINTICADLYDLFYTYIDSRYSYGDTTTVDDDIETYVKENIIKLYQLEDIKLWIKTESSSVTPYFVWDGFSMSETQKKSEGLTESRVMGISAIQGSTFDKKLIVNIKTNTRYTIGLKIIISKK